VASLSLQIPELAAADWLITNECDVACDFCHGVDRRQRYVNIDHRPTVSALVRSPVGEVTLCGGEPALVRDVHWYAITLRRAGIRVTLNTNGINLTNRVCGNTGFMVEAFDRIGISIHGSTPEVQLTMMGPGANLAASWEAAQYVATRPVKLKIATVLSRANQDDIMNLARKVADLRPDVWRIYMYARRGVMNVGQDRHTLSENEFVDLAAQAAALAAPVLTIPATEDDTQGCLLIGPHGDVMVPVGNRHIIVGHVLMKTLENIWREDVPRVVPDMSVFERNKRWLNLTSP
jgi:MoaA/NifB/PqqE/SkfB family radical SAM enzyme